MTAEDVLEFWFAGDPNAWRKHWFEVEPVFDETIRKRFALMLEAAGDGTLDAWRATAHGALALVIVLDQISRNMHRGSYLAYAGDAHARHVARDAIARGDDEHLTPVQRVFLYIPFEHSENAADQETSVMLFDRLNGHPEVADAIAYAHKQRDVFRRFSRFPHRNVILDRIATPEELAFLRNCQVS